MPGSFCAGITSKKLIPQKTCTEYQIDRHACGVPVSGASF